MTFDLKTTSIFLPRESYGTVFVYCVTPEFMQCWDKLKSRFNKGFIPYQSLVLAMKFHFGHFIRFKAFENVLDLGSLFIVSENKIPLEETAMLFDFWETEITADGSEPTLGDLIRAGALMEREVGVGDFIYSTENSCPTAPGWVWDAAKWSLSRRLCETALEVENLRGIRFKIDSDGNLVSWDDCLTVETNDATYKAVHVIKPRLITVAGYCEPAIHLESSLSRLARRWNEYSITSAWLNLGENQPLLMLPIKPRKDPKSTTGYVKEWKGLSIDLLNRTGYQTIKDAEQYDLEKTCEIKARYHYEPVNFPIGKGVGNPFHHYVTRHLEKVLPESTPFGLSKYVGRLKAREALSTLQLSTAKLTKIVGSTGCSHFQIICLYSSIIVRQKIQEELRAILSIDDADGLSSPDNEWMTHGPFNIMFVSPPKNAQMLLNFNYDETIIAWLNEHLMSFTKAKNSITGFIVETCEDSVVKNSKKKTDGNTKQADPKTVIRRWLAKNGANSQFVRQSTLSKKDTKGVTHGARRAVHDLLRATGCNLIPYEPMDEDKDSKTWYLGIFVRLSNRKFQTGLTACLAGGHQSYLYTNEGLWLPMHQGVAKQWANLDRPTDKAATKRLLEQGINKWLENHPDDMNVILVEANGARRIWSGLKDTDLSSGELPVSANRPNTALIRFRYDETELPRPAGSKPTNIEPVNGRLDPGSPYGIFVANDPSFGCTFYCSAKSAVLDNDYDRGHTRFASANNNLKNDRHGQRLTELMVMFNNCGIEKDIVVPVSRLCFQNLSWLDDRKTALPSPIHVATAAIKDFVNDQPAEE